VKDVVILWVIWTQDRHQCVFQIVIQCFNFGEMWKEVLE